MQMGDAWWISLFINIMSFHRLHNPFFLNGPSFSILVPHSGQIVSLGHIFTTLIGINDVLISFFSPFPLSPRPATYLFSSVINTAVGRIGHYGLPAGPSLELFSLVQDGSALPASLRHGIEQSIKVYLSICQLQWAVWWALIGQAFLCFSSLLGYYSGSGHS